MSAATDPSYIPGCVDTHAHLTVAEARGVAIDLIVAQAVDARVAGIIDVGIEPSDLQARRDRLGRWPIVFLTSGLHPTSVAPDSWREAIDTLCAQIDGLVAIGEIGLDYHWSTEHADLQRRVLREQFAIARDAGLPVIIHNRDSEADMIDILADELPHGVMHCFSQDADYCSRCVGLGMHVSFGGNVTFRSAGSIREAVAVVPDELLLVETDSPFLSPQPVRGKPNHPGYLRHTIACVAEVRGTTAERIAELTATNARRLFGLNSR